MEKDVKDLNILLLGNSSAVQFGEENILLGQKQPAEDDFSKTVPELRNESGRNVSVINALDLQEAELNLNSLDQDIVRLISENDIHAFIFIFRLHQLTDTDKMGLDWLENTFGESVLPFVTILFTYEREEDCDTIIDDLKKSPVLEHLLGKCGNRYHTCSSSMNNQSEMKALLEKIGHMVCENKECYTVELYKAASNLQEGLEDRKSEQSVYSPQLHQEEAAENQQNSTGSRKIKALQWIKATVLLLLSLFALTFWKLVKHLSPWALQWIKATVLLLLRLFAFTFWKLVKHLSPWRGNAEDKVAKEKRDQLFLRLHLKRNQKQPLKPADVFQITAQSLRCQEPCAEAELVQSFLQRLLLLDYRARDITAKEAVSVLDHIQSSILNKEENDTFAGFINKKQLSLHEATHTDPIHPMDVQMAVFHCSDSFLKQVIVTKLSQCQYALPLLVPNPFTGEIEFPMWTFRQVRNSWKTKDTAGKVTSKTMPVSKTQTPMVAFFRFGSISSSKSQLMNSLINVKHNTFFHRNCPGSSRERLLMDGVVEIAWYLPSGKGNDHFIDCAAFCNLHGDAGTHKKQLEILTELSSVNVVVLDGKDSDTANNKTLTKLYKGSKPLVCLICEDDSSPTGMNSLKYKIGLKGRNQAAVSEELREIIKHCFSVSHPTFSLEDVGKKGGITTDEDNPECEKGKQAALQMINLLEGMELFKMKEKFLPCQGKLWHEWCKKNKELYQLHGNIEMKNTEIQNEMKQIRKCQQEKGLTKLMELFIQTMHSQPSVPTEKSYFLKWIKIMLDSCTADDLSTLHHEYDEKWSIVLDLKKQHDKSEQMKDEQKQLENISEKLKAATFGLEHILREMGQVYESFISVQRDSKEQGQDVFSCFPKLAAELLISGHPVELMDGDAAHVPLVWVSAVLDEVIKILGDQTISVLSVLGIQSSGKSTMLNAMFGLQFAVSAGRCTRGAFMQLVKVSEEMKEELKFDYILVVDTEGLRALELTGISTRHHDNELATFVIGLGNMTLINIFGENPAEIQDILQIVVQAFLRMKKVHLSPSCMFVHQNVSDVAANEKNMEGRRHLQDVLDKMTELAAKEEVCDAECFNDVIAFDIKNDVRYFAQLWEGCPPMAPTNPSYSENVLELKKALLYPGSQYHGIKLSQIKDRIKDLWNALLNENFVFSFRNTQEISVYRELEEEYGKWTWSLRSAMVKIQDKFHTRINNKQLHSVEYKLLVGEMEDTNEKVKESVKCFFESERQEKDMLDQWSGRFKKKIEDLHEDLVKQAKRELDDTISQRDARKKLDEQKTQYEAKLFEMSKKLALELKGKAKDETELKRHFDSVWSRWVSDLTAQQQPMNEIDIEGDAVAIISEMHEKNLVLERFKKCDKSPHEGRTLDYSNNKKYNTIATVHNYTKYVTKKSWNYLGNMLTPQDQDSIRQLTFSIIHKAKELIKSMPVARLGYQSSYIQEIGNHVKDLVAEHKSKSGKYELRKKFTVDLSLHVCELAREVFAARHKEFREASDPLIYLEKKKPEYYNVFQKSCQGATSVAVFGELICSELQESILKCVFNTASSYLAEKMKTDILAFNGNKTNLEKHILKSLAEEENFEKFLTYIQNPQKHFERFIEETVEKFMKEENPRAMDKIRTIIAHKQQLVITAAETATKEVSKIKGDANLWLKTFSDGLKDELEYNNEHLSAKNCQDINDFQLLTEVVKKEIPIITEDLNRNFKSLSDLKMEMIRKRPDEILIDHFCRCCWVQCPFCKAICTNSVKDHDGDHSVPFHRNYGINGWHYKGTEDLCISFCTTSVASTRSFYPIYDSDVLVPWKLYKDAGSDYANWSITPDLSELPYWKWFVCRFQKDLETYYKKKYRQIPDEWRKYKKEDAIESLDKYFATVPYK